MIDKIYMTLEKVMPWVLGGLVIANVVVLLVGIWIGE